MFCAAIGAAYTTFIFFRDACRLESLCRDAEYSVVRCGTARAPRSSPGARDMLDTILVAAGVGFFAVSILYALACDRM
jgi:hypothetical protein